MGEIHYSLKLFCLSLLLIINYYKHQKITVMSNRLTSVSILLAMMAFSPMLANAATDNVAGVEITQQSSTCRGVIIDSQGEPVIGASILVKGTTTGTITDMDGNFEINNVRRGATLVISFVGYKTQEVVWNGQTLNITLEDDAATLDEVVVTALGMKRSTKALGYAMTELKGDELDANLINPVQALQGKVAGVDISASDGGMFGASKILIRGASTLGKNNQPIYVVDGIILDNSIVENDADWGSGAANYGNELKNLNPDDFETVSVLKGAAATALYGSRGLNGAVVITTKSGRGKKGLGVNVTQTFGFDRVTGQPKLQNEYMEGSFPGYKSGNNIFDENEVYYLNGDGYPSYVVLGDYGDTGVAFGPTFEYMASKYSKMEWFDHTYRDIKPYKNNFKDAYDTGFSTNTNVAISGGNDTTSFYTSVSYKYSDGTLPNNSFQRFSVLAKAAHKITKAVELEASMTFTNSTPRNAQPNIGENFGLGGWDRTYDAKYFRDKYKGAHGGIASATYGDEYGYVPGRDTWWSIWENDYRQKETVVRPNLKLTVDFTPWLKWQTEGSYNYYYVRTENKVPGAGYQNKGGGYGVGFSNKEQINLNTNLLFDKDLNEDFHLNGFLRYELYHNFQSAMSSSTKGDLIMPNQYFLANGSDGYSTSAAVSGEKTIQSVAAQVGFSYRDQLFVDVTGRNDWSSSLVYSDGHGTYSYFYPSINASWLIHESLRLPEFISFWKLRASLAQVGNDTSAYYINSAYSLRSYTGNASGAFYTLSLPGTTYSQNLKPEKKTSWEIGTDFRILRNRIGLDFTFYKENTKNQIMTVSIPNVSGYNNALINAGNIQNSGVEIALNTTPVESKDFTWDLNFTYTKNKSKIIELSDLVAEYITLQGYTNYGNYRVGSVAKVGGAYGTLMTDAAPMRDKDSGMQVLAYSDSRRFAYIRRSGVVEEVGSMMPKFLGSVNTSLRYKNWTLRASFDMRFGGKVASYGSHYGTAYGYLDTSLAGRNPNHGGITWTSKFDGVTYTDGIIPDGLLPKGTVISQPDGSKYTVTGGSVSENGQSYQELYNQGLIEPTHAGTWMYFTNSWSQAVLNDNWFVTLNYIAFRDLSLSYSFDTKIANKIGAKSLNLTAQAHNLGYLLNSMPNKENPEAVAGTAAAEFRIRQFSGVTTSFTFTINASF